MKTYNLILLALLAVFLLGACLSKECKEIVGHGSNYQFVIPATLSPAKDTFRVGDTIMITSVFDDMIYERLTQEHYQLIDWELLYHITIDRLDVVEHHASDVISYFDLIIKEGHEEGIFQYSTGATAFLADYTYNNGTYSLSYELVPQKSGAYVFFHTGIHGSKQLFPGSCRGRGYESDINVELNGGSDNNIDFLLSSPAPFYHESTLQKPQASFHDWGGYCFYVVE